MLVLFTLGGVIAALPALIHARLHGCAGSSCPEHNRTANTNSMQLSVIFDDSGPDRNQHFVILFQNYMTFFLHWNTEDDVLKNVSVFYLHTIKSKITKNGYQGS